jgi:hypothetical protein
MACLKFSGKMPSDSDRLIRVVIGSMSESRHDFKRVVGIKSREQVALEAERMAFFTSSDVAGKNEDNIGGGKDGEV